MGSRRRRDPFLSVRGELLLPVESHRLGKLRVAPRDQPTRIPPAFLVAIGALEDPETAVGKLGLVGGAQCAVAAAGIGAEAADSDAAATAAPFAAAGAGRRAAA